MLLGAESSVRRIGVGAFPAIEGARLGQVVLVTVLCFVLEVDAHHVLEVVAATAELGAIHNAPAGLLLERGLILRNETFRRFMVKTARNLALEALRSVVRVALTIEVLRVNAGDEASVAWDALVANIVHGAVHPGHARPAHISNHGLPLRLLLLSIDRVGAHGVCNLLLLHDGGASVNHVWLVNVPEVLASLPISLSRGLTHDVLLQGNEPGVAGDFRAALHIDAIDLIEIKLQNF